MYKIVSKNCIVHNNSHQIYVNKQALPTSLGHSINILDTPTPSLSPKSRYFLDPGPSLLPSPTSLYLSTNPSWTSCI